MVKCYVAVQAKVCIVMQNPVCTCLKMGYRIGLVGYACGRPYRNASLLSAFVTTEAAARESSPRPRSSRIVTSSHELQRLPFRREGYYYWEWKGHKIHYVVEGKGRPILLIHGVGVSSYHWRFNIPELSKNYKVYAMDLIGFGWSDKALIDYSTFLWRDQVADFIENVVKEPVVLAGHSIGGFIAIQTAAAYPSLISSLVLVNPFGRFKVSSIVEEKQGLEGIPVKRLIWNPLMEWSGRWIVKFTFGQVTQPSRIRLILKLVYKDHKNVDDYLINAIWQPTQDPNAGEVYYRMIRQFIFFLSSSELTLNNLLPRLSCPLLLFWGDLDPLDPLGSSKPDMMMKIYPNAQLIRLQAGHCPHDELPLEVNKSLTDWISVSV